MANEGSSPIEKPSASWCGWLFPCCSPNGGSRWSYSVSC